MRVLKVVAAIIILLVVVIYYLFSTSKVITYKGITVKVPFVNKKVRTDSSLMVLKYPLNGTSLFFSDTKMTKDEFLGSYMVAIAEQDSNVGKKVIKIGTYDVPTIVSKTKASNLEKVQLLIPEKKVVLKITGNENDIKQLMNLVLEIRFDN